MPLLASKPTTDGSIVVGHTYEYTVLPASLPIFVGLLAPAFPETDMWNTATLPSVVILEWTMSYGALTDAAAFV